MKGSLPRHISVLVEAAARKAELEGRMGSGPATVRRPVVTLSREFGARGAVVARQVADLLGFECWNQELVHQVSQNMDKPEEMLEGLDEQRTNMVIQLLGALFAKDELSPLAYQKELRKVIRALAQRGSGVIVGRGGQFVLKREQALRVRVVAPLEDRVAGVAERRGISPEEARRLVMNMDAERAAFMRENFGESIDQANHYDLIVNSSTFSLERCAEVIAQAYRVRFPEA